MTRFEMYLHLFEPPSGWADEETARRHFDAFEREQGRLGHQAALAQHLRDNPRPDDGRPDSSD